MALLIQETGLEQYAPGGTARVKVLTIGGPGVGKTRWASYFPSPIYADCERGLASVADRKVAFVNIDSSQDMLDLLAYLKQECRQPPGSRKYQTVVVDTLDAFARKVKNEWMEKEKKQAFTGWEAWGFLNSRMQMLLTRLLNLDMNVVVAVHFKDKTTKDDETGRETHELMPQLQGETADNIYNDFDLVAWMGTYWETEDGERVQKRGLTFKPTPDKPFLKDRLHVTPPWLEVTFAPSDYSNIFDRIASRMREMDAGGTVGEIPAASDDTPAPSQFVISPGAAGSGALAPTPARTLPLAQMDKPTLLKMARELGIQNTVDGHPIRPNTVKSELLAVLEAHKNAPADPPPAPTAPVEPTPAAAPTPPDTLSVPEGIVDVDTGELRDPTLEQATATIAETLGGVVTEAPPPPPPPATAPVQPAEPTAPPAEKLVCADCGKDLAGQNPDITKLSYIRFRKRYCEAHYAEAKAAKK